MRELEYLALGYVQIRVPEEKFYKAISLFLGKGIRASSKKKGDFIVFYNEYKEASALLKNAGIEHFLIKEFRILNFGKSKTEAAIVISAIVFTLIFAFFLSDLVWRIEIDGCKGISESDVEAILLECGFGVGDAWSELDFGDVENKVLNSSPKIGWININRNGTVAYVSIIEAESPNDDREEYEYSNIVAREDCIIESISVTCGTAMVKVGDAVTKGDLLILGLKDTENGSVPCRAAGSVIGRVNKSISASVGRKKIEKLEESRTLISMNIKIFNFSANIFKKYRNLSSECVIIKENDQIMLFGGCALPVFVEKQYSVKQKSVTYEMSDEDLVSSASERMRQKIEAILATVQLSSIKTYGSFTAEGYLMRTDLIYLCDIGEDAQFFVSENQRE